MATSVKRLGHTTFCKLAHSLKSKKPELSEKSEMRIEVHCPCNDITDVYLYDWIYGIVKMPAAKNIATGISEMIKNFETSSNGNDLFDKEGRKFSFSHIGVYHRENNDFDIFYYGDGLGTFKKWKEANRL